MFTKISLNLLKRNYAFVLYSRSLGHLLILDGGTIGFVLLFWVFLSNFTTKKSKGIGNKY